MTLKIGAVEETITVSGASPIVDVSSTSGAQTLNPDMVNKLIPGSRMYGDMARMIPGLVSTSAPNIGRLGLGSSGTFNAYGDSGILVMIDGFEIRSNTYPDFSSAQEVDVKSFGNSADVAEPGSVWNIVSKSGGNAFHGRLAEQYINDKFQSNNLDDNLRSQGLSFVDSVIYFTDFNADLGGKIVPDKLWFYGAYRDRQNQRSVAGLALTPGADGVYGTGDETPHLPVVWTMNWTGKLSYQPSPKYSLIGFVARDYSINDGGAQSSKAAQRFIPYEAATYQLYPVLNFRGEFRATLRSNLLLNVQVGRMGYTVTYLDTPKDHSNNQITARWDRESGIFTGGSVGPGGNYAEAIRPRTNTVNQANLTYLPKEFLGGGHEFKTGYRMWIQEGRTDVPEHPAGAYQLTYDRVNGLAHQPVEITTFNFPVFPSNRSNWISGYLNDHWQVSRRLTVNLGVRFDYDHSFLPEQTKEQGQFGNAGTFARFEGNTWKDFAPRVGVALDLTNDGKTVIKGTYGIYNGPMADTFAQTFNQNAVAQTVYRWHDLNGNSNYNPGEVNLDVNGGDFLSTTAAANNVFNPDLQRPQQHEVTAVFDRELRANMAGRVAWVYKRNVGDISSINIKRPYSAYNIPLTRRDPGPDGVLNTPDDAGSVVIYDYDAAYRGAAFVANEQFNRPSDREDDFQTLEFTLNRRNVGRWGVSTSLSTTKSHRFIVGIPSSPNDDYFPVDNTWAWGYKVSGNYRLPWDLSFSGVFDVQPGLLGQRTNIFRATDPDGGPPLRRVEHGHAAARRLRRADRRLSPVGQPATVEVHEAEKGRAAVEHRRAQRVQLERALGLHLRVGPDVRIRHGVHQSARAAIRRGVPVLSNFEFNGRIHMRTLHVAAMTGALGLAVAAFGVPALAQRGGPAAPAAPPPLAPRELQTSIADGFTMASVGDTIVAYPQCDQSRPAISGRAQADSRRRRRHRQLRGQHHRRPDASGHRAPAGSAACLKWPPTSKPMGFDLVARSNNHAGEYGYEGMLETNSCSTTRASSTPDRARRTRRRAPRDSSRRRKGRVGMVATASSFAKPRWRTGTRRMARPRRSERAALHALLHDAAGALGFGEEHPRGVSERHRLLRADDRHGGLDHAARRALQAREGRDQAVLLVPDEPDGSARSDRGGHRRQDALGLHDLRDPRPSVRRHRGRRARREPARDSEDLDTNPSIADFLPVLAKRGDRQRRRRVSRHRRSRRCAASRSTRAGRSSTGSASSSGRWTSSASPGMGGARTRREDEQPADQIREHRRGQPVRARPTGGAPPASGRADRRCAHGAPRESATGLAGGGAADSHARCRSCRRRSARRSRSRTTSA